MANTGIIRILCISCLWILVGCSPDTAGVFLVKPSLDDKDDDYAARQTTATPAPAPRLQLCSDTRDNACLHGGTCLQRDHGPHVCVCLEGYSGRHCEISRVKRQVNINYETTRLVEGNHPSEGRVEVLYNSEWGTVCDDHWSMYEAEVVCRDMGYEGADQALVAAAYGEGSGPIWLDDVTCQGTESSLFECSANRIGTHNCGHQDDASVMCTAKGSLRLASGTPSEGKLEVRGNTTAADWTSVCGDTWDDAAAAVACRQLGFAGFASYSEGSERSENEDAPTITGFRCHGDERRLDDCSETRWEEVGDCSRNNIVLRCDPTVVRLMDGPSPAEGRTEVYYGGTWGTICNDYWGLVDAGVFCRELGFKLGAKLSIREAYELYGMTTGAIILDNVECTGSETSIYDCEHDGVSSDNCNHYDDAGAVCLETTKQFRLLSGWSSHEGVVEIWVDGGWGVMCDSGWGEAESDVLCRQLGWGEGAVSGSQSVFVSEISGNVIVRNYDCRGDEELLNDCPWVNNGIACRVEDAVQVSCSPPKEYDLRLVNGGASDQGRLEIVVSGSWGAVRDLGSEEAEVACRQLGFESVIDVYDDAYFGRGSGMVWDGDGIVCEGDEERLDQCTEVVGEGGGSNDHSYDVGLLCKPYDVIGIPEIRLVPDPDSVVSTRGRVEIRHDDVWGTICSESGWRFEEAATACQQLGYSSGSYAVLKPSTPAPNAVKIWLDEVVCDGPNTENVGHCYHSAWGYDIGCDHADDVVIDCFYTEPESSSSIPGWEIAVICVLGGMVLITLVVMAVAQRRREKRRLESRRRRRASMECSNSNEFLTNAAFYTAPPPEYRPPTPTPSEAPPSYDSIIKPPTDDEQNEVTGADNEGGNDDDVTEVDHREGSVIVGYDGRRTEVTDDFQRLDMDIEDASIANRSVHYESCV